VLATLHTNDAMSSVSRLVDLGLDRTTVTAVLRGSLAQRLVRKLCTECKEFIFTGYTEDEERLATQFGLYQTMRAVGCASCNNTGYRGRLPITEVAIVTPSMGEHIAVGATAPQLQRMAVAQGMRPMREVALERVRMQETTLEEVERVLGEVAEEAATVSTSAQPVILLIDDDAMLRHLASAILEMGGYRVIAMPDGETALHVIEGGEDVALVVTDLRMPGMDGEAVLKVLRGRVGTALMPVIVLTGSDEHDTEVRLMDAGADDYIRKPIDPPRFLSRIKAALRRAGVS
jgi:CheY-like chemotaxis protein